jgi:membrane-associated protease RseP (regulator of RpoE activity)
MSSAHPDTKGEGETAARVAAEIAVGADTDTTPEDVADADPRGAPTFVWRNNLLLFLLTVVSVFVTATMEDDSLAATSSGGASLVSAVLASRVAVTHGAQFTFALLAILVAHEFGHYIAARIHKVDTSLPYFIPLPILSPFGTMGAVIRMRGAIPTRRALLDIGASGPLAGLSLAIPIYYYGACHSQIVPIPPGAVELGDSLLLKLLDHMAAPNMPSGMTLMLSPFAFAAWAGMFVTMINLLPVGQLDGGHVAYALFGPLQDRFGRNVHRLVFVFFCAMLIGRVALDIQAGRGLSTLGQRVQGSLFWLTWFQMLALLGTLSRKDRKEQVIPPRWRIGLTAALVVLPGLAHGRFAFAYWLAFGGVVVVLLVLERRRGVFRRHGLFDHPPTSPERLDVARTVVAVVTLLLFVALFMPTPFAI